MRSTGFLPLAFAIVAFVLGLLCLLAGYKPEFLQGYDIMTLNTSSLGHNIIDTTSTSTSTSSSASSSATSSFLSSISFLGDEVASEIEDKLGDAIDDVSGYLADKLAAELGIAEWYNLHLMTMCEGEYKPNATAEGASKNVTHCSKAKGKFHFNITSRLEQSLSLGPFNLSLSDIGYPTERINDGIHDLNIALDAMFILYVIGIVLSGILIFTSLIFILTSGRRLLSLLELLLALCGALAFLIGSIVITVLQKKATHLINKYGNDVGLYAYKGTKYLALTWAATAMLLAATILYLVELCRGRKRSKDTEFARSSRRAEADHTSGERPGFMSRFTRRRSKGPGRVVEGRRRRSGL